MTVDRRFERHLPEILEDLYLGPSPMYRDEVLAAAVRPRQRAAWTFPGRWLPMDVATRRGGRLAEARAGAVRPGQERRDPVRLRR